MRRHAVAKGPGRRCRGGRYSASPVPGNPALLVVFGRFVNIYPLSELRKSYRILLGSVGGLKVGIVYDRERGTARLDGPPARVMAFVASLDKLKTFFPEGKVYRARRHRFPTQIAVRPFAVSENKGDTHGTSQ